jgi:serine-type D-Ala-D-Ala carboxypeptidase/endopeptidase (penicillin-binding protein 4)
VHSNRRFKPLALLCGLLLGCLPGLATAATAAPEAGGLAALQGDLGRQLALAGPHDGAYVYDLSSHQALFSRRASTLRPPASVEKLFTATATLARMGPSAHLSTTVYGVGHMAPGGVWEGNLYLRGGGDPTFGSSSFIRGHYGGIGASVSTLVNQLVRTAGIHHVTGSVLGDEGFLDPLRGEPSSGYAEDPFLEGTLSGLAFNRGTSGSEQGPHAPAAFAARSLWGALKGDGVSIRGASGAASTPAGAVRLAQAPSPSVAELLGLMLPPSDNFFAETLVKDLGALFQGAGTTAAGAAVVSQTMTSLLAITPHVVDGRQDLSVPGRDPARGPGLDADRGGAPRTPGRRRAHRDARVPHAPHERRRPLRRQDRHPHGGLQPRRLLPLGRGPRTGVRDLHRRHLHRSRPHLPGPHGDHDRRLLIEQAP